MELIVTHTHKHGDHYAADGQFEGKPNTNVIGLEVEDLKSFYNISNWPEEIVDFELGNRLMKIYQFLGIKLLQLLFMTHQQNSIDGGYLLSQADCM